MFAVCPRLVDDDFGGLLQVANELSRPLFDPRELRWLRNAPLAALRESEVHNTDKEFRIRLELPYYNNDEVKIMSDNKRVTVTAKHEEKEDKHGFVKREMTRIYTLPDDVDPRSVTSTMNSQGVLTIRATKRAIEAPKEVAIPVEFKQ